MKKLSRLAALAAVSAMALGAGACAVSDDDPNGSSEEQNDGDGAEDEDDVDDEGGELSNPELEGGWVGDPEGEGHDDATVVIRENGFTVFAPDGNDEPAYFGDIDEGESTSFEGEHDITAEVNEWEIIHISEDDTLELMSDDGQLTQLIRQD